MKVGFLNQAKSNFVAPLTYLEKLGISVEKMSLTGKDSAYDQKFMVVLVWADDSTNAQQLVDYCHIVKMPIEGDATDNPLFAKVLVCTNSPQLATAPELKGVSFMPKCFDLRMLDRNFLEIMSGKVIEFIPYEETEIKATHSSDPEKPDETPPEPATAGAEAETPVEAA